MWNVLRAWRSIGLSLVSVSLLGCGARTPLDLNDPCAESGAVRACINACGSGNQTCSDGFWQPCQVPTSTRSCSGLCGEGAQTCDNERWSACLIPIATRSCSTGCGAGQETCENERWQGCVVPTTQRDCSSVCGTGHEVCTAGTWGACDAPQPKPPVLRTTVRDFHRTQSDFELSTHGNASDRGLVASELGPDQKPVYLGNPTTPTTPSGKAGFDVWYRDTPGVNLSTSVSLQLSEVPGSPGLYAFEDLTFFPIDDQLFGNEGLSHNFHFTLETHTAFVYRGGETFSFAGDDDVWVFIANQLLIDLGGLHQLQTQRVQLDAVAAQLGMVRGQKYPLDLFFAERHTSASEFSVKTTIADVGSCE